MSFAAWYYPFFLLLVVAVFWLLPRRCRLAFVLPASFVFYGFWDLRFGALLIAAAVSDYLCTSAMEGAAPRRTAALSISLMPAGWLVAASGFRPVESRYIALVLAACLAFFALYSLQFRLTQETRRRFLLYLAVGVNLGILLFFKYANWFSRGLHDLLQALGVSADPVVLNILLPVGISFHTFQSIAYVVDNFDGRCAAEKSFWRVLCMIMFFPQLVAGPIERAGRLLPQLKFDAAFSWERVAWGAHLLFVGYFLKLFVADNCALVADAFFNGVHRGEAFDARWAFAGVVAYAAQIYGDFAGYSYIARGSAAFLGVSLTRNFELPYLSRSPGEFWSRWHISLSSWFRDYVFFPLSLSSTLRRILALPFGKTVNRSLFASAGLILTMLLAGAWHGAAWNFVAFGAFHGVLQALWAGVPALKAFSASPKMPQRLASAMLTFALVCGGWVLFRCARLGEAVTVLAAMSGLSPQGQAVPSGMMLWLAIHILPLVLLTYLVRRGREEADIIAQPRIVLSVLYLFMALLLFSSDAGRTQFIYFQF